MREKLELLMAKDSRMFEMKSGGVVDENELMLELSIGGIFGKSEKTNGNVGEPVQKDDRREDLNVQPKREIQALRRRELRRKREEKLKKSVGFGSCGSASGPFTENKEWLEKQMIGQNHEVLVIEPARKKERIGNSQVNVGSVSTAPIANGFVNENVTPVCGGGQVAGINEDLNTKNPVFPPTACRNFRPYINLKPIEDEIEGGGRRNCKVNSNGSGGYASSAFSDSQCSRQGGVTDDSGSNSSNSQIDQQLSSTSAASDPSDQPTGSPKQTVSANKVTDSTVPELGLVKPTDHFKPPESRVSNPPSKLNTSSQHQTQTASLLARMPCVSTTGNGPNGKTISGFLYRYTKIEVSIVCVCHGRSFSPAGFVEHAGGVGIVHPLKHITILPTAFAS